jgi:spore photoproduct lyase
MFKNVFVEKEIINSLRVTQILEKLKLVPTLIDNYQDYFGIVKKPYLQKRESLNLFIAKKKGTLIKEAPPAYGLTGVPHYYFVHAYNCIYECDYCYLQGHFDSPDIVLFTNFENVADEMSLLSKSHPEIWFHAGEFSDSLALSHISGELPLLFDFFKIHTNAKLELRTKSVNIRELKKLTPLKNIITSFSLSPDKTARTHDLKTPGLSARLKAMKELYELGHPLAIHFDPIIYHENFLDNYRDLLEELMELIPVQALQYVSVGVVRFPANVFYQVQNNYPKSSLHRAEFITGSDGKIKYPRPMRLWILNKVKELCLEYGISSEKVYLCMED